MITNWTSDLKFIHRERPICNYPNQVSDFKSAANPNRTQHMFILIQTHWFSGNKKDPTQWPIQHGCVFIWRFDLFRNGHAVAGKRRGWERRKFDSHRPFPSLSSNISRSKIEHLRAGNSLEFRPTERRSTSPSTPPLCSTIRYSNPS